MNKLVTDGASGPAASEHGLIAVQPLLTDFAMSRFNREQHRLPITTGSSDAHMVRSITNRSVQKQEAHVVIFRVRSLFSDASFPLISFLPLKAFGRERSSFIGEAGTIIGCTLSSSKDGWASCGLRWCLGPRCGRASRWRALFEVPF